MSHPNSIFNQRYTILRELGEGAQGKVDLAQDSLKGNRLVAVKTLRPKQSPSWLALFRKEFELLAGMEHSKLCPVYDFGTTNTGHIYFTREFVKGVNLYNGADDLDMGALIAVAVEVCRSLRPLHRLGLVHGDIKPGNLIIDPSSICRTDHGKIHCTVRPIDFSFARPIGKETARRGTVQYMAPEIIKESYMDQRIDLYAFGITLFEILAGSLPFDGSIERIISGHLSTERPTPESTRIELGDSRDHAIYKGLIKIIRRLMSHRIEDRFPDLDELEAALTSLAPDLISEDQDSHLPVENIVSNREKTLHQVTTKITEKLSAPEDLNLLYVIEGKVGAGKHGVCCATKWQAQLNGYNVIEVSCDDSPDIYSPIRQMLNQGIWLSSNTESQLALGKQLLLDVNRAETHSGFDINSLASQIGLFFHRATSSNPLLIIVENLQDGTEELLTILRGIIAQMRPSDPFGLLATTTEEFPWKDHLGRGEQIVLPPLTEENIRNMVTSFLGQANDDAIQNLLIHTEGNPLFVSRVLRHAASSGKGLVQLDDLGPPLKIETYWQNRFAQLRKEYQQFITAIAVFHRPIGIKQIAHIAHLSEQDTASNVSILCEKGWLKQQSEGYHIASAPLRRQILNNASHETLSKLHERAFDVASYDADKVIHSALCENKQFAEKNGISIALSQEASGSLSGSKELLTVLVNNLKNESIIQQATLILGRIEIARGNTDKAERHLLNLITNADGDLKRQTLILLAKISVSLHQLDAAAEYLNQALSTSTNTDQIAAIYSELAEVEFRSQKYDEALSIADRGLDCAPQTDPSRVSLLCVKSKTYCSKGDHAMAIVLCNQAVEIAISIGNKQKLALARDMRSWVLSLSGKLDLAVEELKIATSLYREIGDLPRLTRSLEVLGNYYWWLEKWDLMLKYYEEALRLVASVTNPAQRVEMLTVMGFALNRVGRFEQSSLILNEAKDEALRLKNEELFLKALVFEGDLYAWQGKFEQALTNWQQGFDGFEKRKNTSVCAELALEMAEVHLQTNGTAGIKTAKDLLHQAALLDRKDKGRQFDHIYALVESQLMLAMGRFEDGIRLVDSLIEKLDKADMLDLQWQAQLCAAKSLIDNGSDVLARQRLRKAEKILDTLAAGIPRKHRVAFWQDIRRAEVRRLLAITTPSSNISFGLDSTDIASDSEAAALYKVLELNKRLSTETNLSNLMEAILDAAIELTGAERGFILTPGSQGLDVRAAREVHKEETRNPHDQFSRSIAESVFLDREPVVTIDASGDNRFKEFLSIHELKIRSVACLPISYRSQMLGVLYLENRLRPGKFDRKDLRVLSAFSDQVAIAVFQAKVIDDSHQKQRELEQTKETLEQMLQQKQQDLQLEKNNLRLAKEQLGRVKSQVEGQEGYHGLVGTGESMQRIFNVMDRVKDMDVPVVLVGESGTGKDIVARTLHDISNRQTGPFISVACGAVPDTLVESTLFGYTKGAFSGAESPSPGVIAAASGGTLYLDDIGEMPPRMQIDMLRVLQEGAFSPIGTTQLIRTDFRLICSSKEPLSRLVEQGRLRQDLLYRLQVLSIELPQLSERKEDIPLLARRFISRETKRINKPNRSIAQDALQQMMSHSWLGNIRELEQTIRRALVISEDDQPLSVDLLFGNVLPPVEPSSITIHSSIHAVKGSNEEKEQIVAALEKCQWNKSKTAKLLDMPRRTFYRRLKLYGLIR